MAQTHRSLTMLALAITASSLLSGCPAPAQRPSPPGSTVPSPPPAGAPTRRPPAPPRENRLSPATLSLVTQARALLAHGDFNGASSTLDRALRIEPNDPLLWI